VAAAVRTIGMDRGQRPPHRRHRINWPRRSRRHCCTARPGCRAF
jgi:hypothetical protein